ncbi:hypothetical protein FRB93_009162 [Tulasnella sp. JGI-2019a]|nr:hypothetical protein FRB93_009162 [Tulasnella sp. JGI-2019a]
MAIAYDIWLAPKFLEDRAVLAQYSYMTVTLLAIDILNTWYCTGLICYRLCSMMRQKRATASVLDDVEADATAGGSYRRIIWVLIQSGMLYSITEAVLLICVLTKSRSGIYIMNYLISRTTGISSVLIIIQLNILPPRSNTSENSQQSPTGNSGSYSMPVFRKWVKDESTTDDMGIKGISQSSTYEVETVPMTSYLVPNEERSHEQSRGSVEHPTSYLAPHGEPSHSSSSSTVAGSTTA